MLQAYVLSFANGITVDRSSADQTIIDMPLTRTKLTFMALSYRTQTSDRRPFLERGHRS
jgi:hypothetical protein